MLLPYRFQPDKTYKRRQKISNTNLEDDSHRERDVKRPQMTSNYLRRPHTTSNSSVFKPV